jgi:hypothetical protein
MKTMTRNYSVCALAAAVLLAMAVLVTGCPAEPSTDAGYKPSPGMGAVQLKFGPIARATTLPDAADETWFAIFGLEFHPWNSGPTTPGSLIGEAYYTLTDLASPIELPPGDYTLIVIGYATENDGVGEDPAATGSLEELTITLGPPTTETITLKAYDPDESTGNGLFAWKITADGLSDPLDSIIMNVTTIAGATAIANRDIKAELTNTTGVALPAGYYYVVFSLTTEGGIEKEFRHVLHIYQNMTSTFTYTFTDAKLGIDSVGKTTFIIKYDPVEDYAPTWSVSGATTGVGTEDDPVTLSSTVTSRTITVTNFDDYDGKGAEYDSIEWYCNGEDLTGDATGAVGEQLAISTAKAPFDEEGVYQLIIVGIVGDEKAYEAEIFIEVK